MNWRMQLAEAVYRLIAGRIPPSSTHDWDVMPDYRKEIEEWDRREVTGEVMIGPRPRFPGGSDF